MKNLFKFLIITFLGISVKSNSQTHSTIDNVNVSYKSVAQNSVSASLANLQVVSNATITIKANVPVSKIHLKIKSQEDNSVVYQTNHSLNSSNITNEAGFLIFGVESNIVYISNGSAISLKPYIYEIQTEDSSGNLSPLFSAIK